MPDAADCRPDLEREEVIACRPKMKAHGSQATLAAWSSGTTSATKHKDCGFESSQDPTIKEFQKEGC